MNLKQNNPNYLNDSSSPRKASPLLKSPQDFPFKSPLTSAQKKKGGRNRNYQEGTEAEYQNPFSGPIFAPMQENRDRFSPFSFTPNKVKEEFSLGDFTGGSKDHHLLSKPFESPYTTFCKDLSFSPGPYSFASPSTLLMRLHQGGVGLPNNAYSPMFDNNIESPMFAARKNITKLDFNNPTKYIMLKSHKDEISIEPEEQVDLLELSKNSERAHFGPPQNSEDSFAQPAQIKLPSKKSIYSGSMVPSQIKNNEIYSTQDSNSRKESIYNSRPSPINNENEEEEHEDQYVQERYLRTPSPSAHNKKIKLESMNSFSEQAKKFDKSQNGKDMGSEEGYNDSCENSMMKGRMGPEEYEEADEFTISKAKKKICCNCKKSRCLKLYCDCFGRGIPCARECNCVNCLNTESHTKERHEAMMAILERNPSAFKPKIDRTESPEKIEDEQGRVRHMKGCNCKKSGCLKRYCECYQAGVKCTELCKCENCKNMDSCCRFKRAQNYGLLNFGSQEGLNMGVVYSESKPIKQSNKYIYKKGPTEEIYEEDEDTLPYHSSQIRLVNNYNDPRYYSDLPPSKKRKMNISVSEFTPKRTLVFPKEGKNEQDDEEENEYPIHLYREKKKGTVNFRAPFPQTEIKKLDKMAKDEDYTPSPGKNSMAGRRARRVVRPFSQFNSDEYELRK